MVALMYATWIGCPLLVNLVVIYRFRTITSSLILEHFGFDFRAKPEL